MPNFKLFIRKYYPLLAISVVVLTLFITNYRAGTWLSGWDNLHPERSIIKYISNDSLFGVWQQNYGLGTTISNATTTEIFRAPFIFLLNVFFPSSIVRY